MMYVFLDIDGVTHPVSANGRFFREENISALESAIGGFDLKIIISSTWRLDKSLIELKERLGPKLGSLVEDVTPEIDDPFLHCPRQAEVELYLSQAGEKHVPWVAIDDTRAFYCEDAPVVIIDGSVGFSATDIRLFRNMVTKLFY